MGNGFIELSQSLRKREKFLNAPFLIAQPRLQSLLLLQLE